jgi:hypothetical protein
MTDKIRSEDLDQMWYEEKQRRKMQVRAYLAWQTLTPAQKLKHIELALANQAMIIKEMDKTLKELIKTLKGE